MKLKAWINCTLVIASITFISKMAIAQTTNSNNIDQPVKSTTSYLKPFNLTFLAYQGYLKQQGIPSAGALIFEYRVGHITAQDIVKAAIKANKLPEQFLHDESYINAVDLQLSSFLDDDQNYFGF